MPLSREERKLLHQKSKQPTLGVGKPDDKEGYDGDISFRQIDGSGTVEYVKQSNEWVAVASSGEMPAIRIVGGTRGTAGGAGISSHDGLAGLGDDDHEQYLLIDGSRAMTSTMIIGSDADGTDRSVVWGHSTLKTIMGIDDSSDAFVINTDAAFDVTLANNSFSIDASHNVIIAGNLTIAGGDITLANGSTIDSSASAGTLLLTEDIVKSSAALQSTTTMTVGTDLTVTGGDIVYGNGQNATNTITATAHNAAGKALTISAGNTTAGTTNNIAGGALTFQGGQGKGSGAGGDIIFQTANAGSSGSTLNSLATALTISDDLTGAFAGDLTVGDDLSLTSDNSVISMGDGGPFNITHSGDGATIEGLGALVVDSAGSTVTVDGHTGVTLQSTSSGDILLDSAADVVLDAAGGNFEFKDAGTTQLTIDVDGTAGDIDINLNVDGDDLVFNQFDGTEVMRITDTARVGIGDPTPESLLHMKGADPVLTIQDTETGAASADARVRLAESDGSGNVENYWDIHNSGHNLLLTRSDGTGNVVIRSCFIDDYAVNIKPADSTNHMTMGLADKQNNYSLLGIYSAAAASISGVTADTSFDNW